jgi:hypothetical protein
VLSFLAILLGFGALARILMAERREMAMPSVPVVDVDI